MCLDCEIDNFDKALPLLEPGDTLLIENGVYSGGTYFIELQGTEEAWINIIGEPGEVLFRGNYSAFQLADAEYVRIYGVTAEQQTSNGANIDDQATFESPSHHIILSNCVFRNIASSGNNDLLKLSGLDTFLIESCTFSGGSPSGSGADMVGCHSGTFFKNHFEDLGSNAIQCKGGTSEILIERNTFINAGRRGINLGGSTGLDFFRPQDANYEARNLKVYSNIFIGCEAPLAYVGSENCEVINNTIIKPDKWIFRILQEWVDTERFIKCRNNSFVNNIVLVDGDISSYRSINIGANTLPETFDISNNIWYNIEDSDWRPILPIESENEIYSDPLLQDIIPSENSPALHSGRVLDEPKYDFFGNEFIKSRSIGAIEIGEEIPNKLEIANNIKYTISGDYLVIRSQKQIKNLQIIEINGRIIKDVEVYSKQFKEKLQHGIYLVVCNFSNGKSEIIKLIK